MGEGQSLPPTGSHTPCLILPGTQLWDAGGNGLAFLGVVSETNMVIGTLPCPERRGQAARAHCSGRTGSI